MRTMLFEGEGVVKNGIWYCDSDLNPLEVLTKKASLLLLCM